MKALISVSDKAGVVDFAKRLESCGWEILSTSGTMKMLREAGVKVTSVSDVTGFPEICDGRVKTLHPKIHGALLARRDDPSHMEQLARNGIETIDLVCVNLYPFKKTVANPDVTMEDAIENIDIGGPSMLRSAAKNWEGVTVVTDPADYDLVASQIESEGNTTRELRLQLSAKAFTHTAEYDSCIAAFLRPRAGLSEKLFLEFEKKQDLRYGENPHQQAAFYKGGVKVPFSLATARQLWGKELSYNNIQDANAALDIVREFAGGSDAFAVGLKHMNPCGAGIGATVEQAWQKAYDGDRTSIFGGIVAFNREVTAALATSLKAIFLEIVMAPSFSQEALEILKAKKNLRLLEVDMDGTAHDERKLVSVNGGLLVQEPDIRTAIPAEAMCVTSAKPDKAQLSDLGFAWKIVKHVKSNSIVVARDGMVLGVGAGQMNRIGSALLALDQAEGNFKTLGIAPGGLVMASDGFFPFDDCVTLAAQRGVTAIVQPGGSVRDEDSVKKADESGIAMLMTGERHFKH